MLICQITELNYNTKMFTCLVVNKKATSTKNLTHKTIKSNNLYINYSHL